MLTEPVPTLLSVICRTARRGGFPTGEVIEGVFEHDRNIGLKSNKKTLPEGYRTRGKNVDKEKASTKSSFDICI